MGAVLTVHGTSADAGKTTFCTALCRYFSDQGYSVAPFKAQSVVTEIPALPDGCINARAQLLQAAAARCIPTAAMNPVLLTPVSAAACRVYVRGKKMKELGTGEANNYLNTVSETIPDSLAELQRQFDLVIIDGLNNPAESKLLGLDTVLNDVPAAARSPVIIIADIDRGGMFAYIAGTLSLLESEERQRVCGMVVNRFRGMRERLQPGLDMLEEITKTSVLGVIPHIDEIKTPYNVDAAAVSNEKEDYFKRIAAALHDYVEMDVIRRCLQL